MNYSEVKEVLVFVGIGLSMAILGYVILRILPALLKQVFDKTPGLNRIDKTFTYFISELMGIGLVLTLVAYTLSQLPESAAVIAVLVTVASGAFIFTSEGWLQDAFAGISFLLYPPYRVGNLVTLGGDKRGRVKQIGLFRTELTTLQLDVISVRNSTVLGEDVINHSGIPLYEVDTIIHVAGYGEYGDDIRRFKADALEVLQQVQQELCPEAVESGRPAQLYFLEFGGSSDHIHAVFYTYDKDEEFRIAVDMLNTTLAEVFRPRGVVLGQVNENTNTIEGTLNIRSIS